MDSSGKNDRASQVQTRSGYASLTGLPQFERKQIVALLNAGRHLELESRTRILIDKYPNSWFAWKMLGASLDAQGKDKDALAASQKAAELKAEASYNFWSNMGSIFGQIFRL